MMKIFLVLSTFIFAVLAVSSPQPLFTTQNPHLECPTSTTDNHAAQLATEQESSQEYSSTEDAPSNQIHSMECPPSGDQLGLHPQTQLATEQEPEDAPWPPSNMEFHSPSFASEAGDQPASQLIEFQQQYDKYCLERRMERSLLLHPLDEQLAQSLTVEQFRLRKDFFPSGHSSSHNEKLIPESTDDITTSFYNQEEDGDQNPTLEKEGYGTIPYGKQEEEAPEQNSTSLVNDEDGDTPFADLLLPGMLFSNGPTTLFGPDLSVVGSFLPSPLPTLEQTTGRGYIRTDSRLEIIRACLLTGTGGIFKIYDNFGRWKRGVSQKKNPSFGYQGSFLIRIWRGANDLLSSFNAFPQARMNQFLFKNGFILVERTNQYSDYIVTDEFLALLDEQ